MDRRATVEAIQLSLTPPKSWSPYGASGLDECRAVRAALDAGVSEVVRVLEAEPCIRVWRAGPDGKPLAMRGRGGVGCGLRQLALSFWGGDPHLHVHMVLCAAGAATSKVIDTLELVNASGRLAWTDGFWAPWWAPRQSEGQEQIPAYRWQSTLSPEASLNAGRGVGLALCLGAITSNTPHCN